MVKIVNKIDLPEEKKNSVSKPKFKNGQQPQPEKQPEQKEFLVVEVYFNDKTGTLRGWHENKRVFVHNRQKGIIASEETWMVKLVREFDNFWLCIPDLRIRTKAENLALKAKEFKNKGMGGNEK